jgi:hypothetical protein
MTRFILLVTLLSSCSKTDHEKTDKLAKICVQAGDALKRDASAASAEDFESLLGSTLESCSQACDGKDGPSCKHLDEHLRITCKVMPSMCETLCSDSKSPSLKSQSCELSRKKT